MSAPRCAVGLLKRLASPDLTDEVVGDLEEVHRARLRRHGRVAAWCLTWLEALDMAIALVRARRREQAGEGERGGRSRRTVGVSWLDFKLGFRMLVRYPGLTVVGGLAIAFAIWVGAGTFEFVTQLAFPKLPLPDGDRIVGVRVWDASAGRVEPRVLHDFLVWREDLSMVRDLGVFRTRSRNLIVGDGRGEPVDVAEISAAAFRLARVAPLLGRTLVDEDERPGASPVVVIGYDVWRTRLGGDSAVVGRTVRLDGVPRTVVGVMPERYGFPIAHEVWVPFPLPPDVVALDGPAIRIFGRLESGATLERAQAELGRLGRRAAEDSPETHTHLRPQVVPYAGSILNLTFSEDVPAWFSWQIMSSNLLLVMLLVLICANVALLIFARAATRESEIVVRNALGASRGRIIAQLFAEALVLGGLAATLGLVATGLGLRWAYGVVEAEFIELPFWFQPSLSPATLVYAVALTLFGAVVAGVLPALKVTRGLAARLKQTTAGGGGLHFGGLWTAVIVTQVAVTVTFPAVAFFVRQDREQIRTQELGFGVERYLTARLELDRESVRSGGDTTRAAFLEYYGATTRTLERRLEAEPNVTAVTFADRLPRMYHAWNQIEVLEGAAPPPDARGHRVGSASVDIDYFDVLATKVLAGRAFHSGDLQSGARVAIVNQPFVERVLGGANAIGRHVRYVATEASREWSPGPWHEIVGVVPDLGTNTGYGRAGIYHPAEHARSHPVYIAMHVRGDATAFGPRLRAVAASVDPSLRLHDVMTLDRVIDDELRFYGFWLRLSVVVSCVALLLSLAGIYSVMSFTVARRTREIGIRVALGADPRRVVLAIFRRPLAQVTLGIVIGAGLTAGLASLTYGRVLTARQTAAVIAYAGLMLGVCLLACLVPTRRALAVEPTEAMRIEG